MGVRRLLIEYSTRTTYTDFQVRRIVRRYVLRGGSLERDAPLALRPVDFVDEWIRSDWPAASEWTTAGVRASALEGMHRKENFEGGDYGRTMHCEVWPEHLQVELYWSDLQPQGMVDRKHMYFLVRWLPPYRFSMSGVRDHPWAGCTERDPTADETRTLFPVHSRERW